jgi:beta-catenin-like protein 1
MDPRKLVKYEEEYIDEEDQQFQDEPMVVFDDKQLKEIINLLDHNFKLNSDLRMRYPNQPDKFIDSEVELDEEIRKLQTLPAYPELYPLFYNSNALSIIVQLLLHNN